MDYDEKFEALPKLREAGNRLYSEQQYHQAATKYAEALDMLDQLCLRLVWYQFVYLVIDFLPHFQNLLGRSLEAFFYQERMQIFETSLENVFGRSFKEDMDTGCTFSKFGKENFFGFPRSSDVGRSLENALGKFQKCGSWLLCELSN